MIHIQGFYYDGKNAARKQVDVYFYDSGEIILRNEHLDIHSTLIDVRISPRVADTARSIYFPDGAKLETWENDAIDTISNYFALDTFHLLVHKLENNWIYVVIALLGSVLIIWSSIEYGIPLLAKITAQRIPPAFERQYGEQSLQTLDEFFFKPSTLGEGTKRRLHARFQDLTTQLPQQANYRLEFRGSPKLGANALTLPGGIIIITDEMVRLADNDEQIIAVLAHEIGHVENRHIMRSFFQNSITALFMACILGDLTSISSFSATLPTFLVKLRYTREFELEADLYALTLLDRQRIPYRQFVLILEHLQGQEKTEDGYSFLATHPATHQRTAIIKSKSSTIENANKFAPAH